MNVMHTIERVLGLSRDREDREEEQRRRDRVHAEVEARLNEQEVRIKMLDTQVDVKATRIPKGKPE